MSYGVSSGESGGYPIELWVLV